MILAKHALHIAAGKENIGDTVFAAEHRLFPFVTADGTDGEFRPALAKSALVRKTVHTAFARTANAMAQVFEIFVRRG